MSAITKPKKGVWSVSDPAPTVWYLLWTGVWLCTAAAYALMNAPLDSLFHIIRVASWLLVLAAFYIRFGLRGTLIILAVAVLGTLIVMFIVRPPESETSSQFALLTTNFLFSVSLIVEAIRSGGVEWQIVKDSALPALGLLMVGGFIYFISETLTGLPPLSGDWVWLIGGTAWIGSAAVIARRYV
ncbi:MAG TPA: hypothetical protein VND22_00590 [Actinomycetota bacterium]|nr:hypothetical protein [Actinomycetota bacterium]